MLVLNDKIGERLLGEDDDPIIVIAFAPTPVEYNTKRPFSSPAHQKFEGLALQSGITNIRYMYMVDSSSEREETHFKVSKKTGVYTSTLFQEYRDKLYDRLDAIKPSVIVALGDAVMYALVGRYGITKRRGSPYKFGDYAWVIPTLVPPTQIFKQLDLYYIKFDLQKAKRFRDEGFTPVKRDITIVKGAEETIALLRALHNEEEVGMDIETSISTKGLISIAFAPEPERAFVIPFMHEKGLYWSLGDEKRIWREIASVLENPEIKKIGQNFFFDTYYLKFLYHIHTVNMDDTMVAMGTLFHEFPKGLDFITSIYTDEPYYKDEGKEAMRYVRVDKQFFEYNAKDSMVTLEAMRKLRENLKQMGNYSTYENQVSLLPIFLDVAYRGIRMDVKGMKKLSLDLQKEIDEYLEEIKKIVGYPINPASPKQLIEYFYEKKGYPPYRNKGRVTTDVNALKRLKRKGDKVASLILDYRKVAKLKGTYTDMQLDPDNRLRCFWKISGTAFGRLASSKTLFETGANMQNLHPAIKKYMQPDPGYIGYSIDLEQAENRIVAALAHEVTMLRAFEDGTDIHSLTASFIFDKSYEQIVAENRNKVNVPLGDGRHSARFWGKKANHGLNYALGYKQFSLLYEIPERDGHFIVEKYHSVYPDIREWHKRVREQITRKRYLENPFGRKIYFLDFAGDQLYKAAYASIPQSTVPDIINRWGLQPIHNKELPHSNEVQLLNQVHDSIVFQIPLHIGLDAHAEFLLALQDSLVREIEYEGVVFKIPISIEFFKSNFKSTKEIKSKNIPRGVTRENITKLSAMLQSGLDEIE